MSNAPAIAVTPAPTPADAIMSEGAAALEARLEWRSACASHVDRIVVAPNALQADGRWLAAADVLQYSDEVALDATPWCQPAGLEPIELAPAEFRPRVEPVRGRFYPRQAFGRLLGGPRDLRPVRLIARDAQTGRLRVDPNHPLAAAAPRLLLHRSAHPAAPGVRLAELFDGPGMQRCADDPAVTYFAGSACARQDEAGDVGFYATPRLTRHLDAQCRAALAGLYAPLLQPGMRLLDLMSSWDSHLPEATAGLRVSGLGMNQEELAANPRLAERVVQDLNTCPTLPWADASFDGVINTASIEYLTRPASVIAEVLRVLRPGGVFAISFSDRWFPSKAIRVWSELHAFERLGLVLSLLSQAGFDKLQTETLRGVKRPAHDKYSAQRNYADPLFAVWGRKSNQGR